jgi:uncharacterized protein
VSVRPGVRRAPRSRFVDFRLRPPTAEYSVYHGREMTVGFNRRVGCEPAPSFLEGSLELLYEEMAAANVEVGVVIGRTVPGAVVPNDHVAELVRTSGNRLVGFAGIDPTNAFHDALDEIERCRSELGLVGAAVDPGLAGGLGNEPGLYPDDRRLYPIYERCEAAGIPVELMTGPFCGRDLSYTDPARIDSVAADFPELTLILGHGCWPYAAEIVAVALRRPNVYISPDIYHYVPGAEPYVAAANSFLADQLLFATAYPARPLQATVEAFDRLPIRDDAKEKIAYGNAARLLALEPL